MMNRVVEILMKRDGVTEEEAKSMGESCASELADAVYGTSLVEPDEVIMNELGLEPDYLEDILEFA